MGRGGHGPLDHGWAQARAKAKAKAKAKAEPKARARDQSNRRTAEVAAARTLSQGVFRHVSAGSSLTRDADGKSLLTQLIEAKN